MTDAELDWVIEAVTLRINLRPAPVFDSVSLPPKLAADLVRAARELRELRRDATSRDGAR